MAADGRLLLVVERLEMTRSEHPGSLRKSHKTAVAIITRLGWVCEGMEHAEHAWRQLAVVAQSRYSRDTVAIHSRYSRDTVAI